MPSPTPARAAYCDIDGTLAATNIVTPLIWYRRRLNAPAAFAMWQASLLYRAPYWLLLDKLNRDKSNRAIYSNYAGLKNAEVLALSSECYDACVKPRIFAPAIARLRALKNENVAIVLVTGGLDFLMQPLARELDATLVAPTLLDDNGICSGKLNRNPLTGHEKALATRGHAQANGISLKDSFAFGDAFGDLEMLECVGNPVAVRPDSKLAGIAKNRGWKIEEWR